MPEAYLTIDDSPSVYTNGLLDFLKERDIQALFFIRGAFLEEMPEPMIRAAKEGHLLANHTWSHTPAGQLGFDTTVAEINRTEHMIDDIYKQADVKKPGKYFRFPYLDRGNGIKTEQEYDELIGKDQDARDEIFHAPNVVKLQSWLHANDYTQPFHDITHPLYQMPEIRNAADCLLTYTSFDWMLTARHKGQQKYKTLEDLKLKIDNDPYLAIDNSSHIVLFHDDREGILPEVCALIDHMRERGITFRNYGE